MVARQNHKQTIYIRCIFSILKEESKPVIDYSLFEVYPDKEEDNHITIDILRNAGYKVYDVSKIKEHIPSARSVVDLHIEKLVPNKRGMSNNA